MDVKISPNLHILLSYITLVFLIYMLYQLVALPSFNTSSEQRDSAAALVTQNKRFTTAIEEYKKEMANTNTPDKTPASSATRKFIQAETPALAGAQLQALLKQHLNKTGAKLNSASTLPEKMDGAFQETGVNLRFRTSLEVLINFMYKVETQDHALFIDNLVIQSRHRKGRVLSSSDDELEVRLDVHGFIAGNTGGQTP